MNDAAAASTGKKAFPEQDLRYLGKRVEVCFCMHFPDTVYGKIVRRDNDGAATIIQLDGGHYVLGSECQWKPLP